MASLANHDHHAVEMRANVNKYKEESARVRRLSFMRCYFYSWACERLGKSRGVYFVSHNGWFIYGIF